MLESERLEERKFGEATQQEERMQMSKSKLGNNQSYTDKLLLFPIGYVLSFELQHMKLVGRPDRDTHQMI